MAVMVRPVDGADELSEFLSDRRRNVVVLGPGLGRDDWSRALYGAVLDSGLPLVLDADALNLLAQMPEIRGSWVLTPHPGEASRLLGVPTAVVVAEPEGVARRLAEKSGATVVLKGFRSVVAAPAGRVARVLAGNPGMATGGSGDVLTGVVGALLARGWPAWARCCCNGSAAVNKCCR